MLPQNPDNTEHRSWDTSSAPLFPFGFGLSYAQLQGVILRIAKDDMT